MATSESTLNMATDDALRHIYTPRHLVVLCRDIHSGGCPNTGAQLPVVTENGCNARRSPKWGLEGGAGKDDHFAKNTAVEFLNPVRAHLPRDIRNFIPKRLAILLFIFENEACLRALTRVGKWVFVGWTTTVLSAPNRADKRCNEAADTPLPQERDV